jgi:hypothetical protein
LGLICFTKFSSALKVVYQTSLASAAQHQKNGEVGPNFIVFMKQQKRCFTNKIFKLTHEVGHKLPAIATVYIKNGSICGHGGRCGPWW